MDFPLTSSTGLPPELPGTIVLHELKQQCSTCSLRELCLPPGLNAAEWGELDAAISTRRRVRKHEALYWVKQPFSHLFAIRFGSFKSSLLTDDGREQLVGFHLPGELIGFDGVGEQTHAVTTTALEDSEVCLLEYARLETLAREIPALHRHLYRVMAREVRNDHAMMLLLGKLRAEERLAAFLIDLSDRYERRGYSATEFILRMSREEIGNFLGLKLETVSRLFSRFQESGLIRVRQKDITILDRLGLAAAVSPMPPCAAA